MCDNNGAPLDEKEPIARAAELLKRAVENEPSDIEDVKYLSDPDNTRRYLAHVEMLEALDTEQFAALYQKNYPLFQQAWRELGYTDSDFNDRLLDVIGKMERAGTLDDVAELGEGDEADVGDAEAGADGGAGDVAALETGPASGPRPKRRCSMPSPTASGGMASLRTGWSTSLCSTTRYRWTSSPKRRSRTARR